MMISTIRLLPSIHAGWLKSIDSILIIGLQAIAQISVSIDIVGLAIF
ncbi:hypothetical protein [Chamaesiphon sp.]